MKSSASRKKWTRDELFIVLNLYHKLAFGQFDQRNASVMALAERLRRTPSSVAMKLSNLASFDPALRLRGIKGLQGASKLDREMWEEFHGDLEGNIIASEEIIRDLFGAAGEDELEVSAKGGIRRIPRAKTPPEVTESIQTVKQRRGQAYFRECVLNNYEEQCAVTRIAVRDLLVASHILPWSSHPKERLNVQNGISLSRLHDAAFDRGYIAFDHDYCLLVSGELRDQFGSWEMFFANFERFEGQTLFIPPEALPPNPEFLAEHRETVFRG
ncbi:MAG: HNH endonuclease [Lentisphaerae bacterium]|nr:HNH endonuclease [Lentisphaerota bacterium]